MLGWEIPPLWRKIPRTPMRARLVSHLTSCHPDLDDTSKVRTDLIEILAIKDQIRH